MNPNSGFIFIWRGIRQHWIWQDEKGFKRWCDLIMEAAYEPCRVRFAKVWIDLSRGQTVTSVRTLMHRWKTNSRCVTDFLDSLERENMISCLRDKRYTIITIINYDDYQSQIHTNGGDVDDEVLEHQRLHIRQRERSPNKEDNKIINKQNEIDDDARAQDFFVEATTELKIEQGCRMFRLTKEEYFGLVKDIISEWTFNNEQDWSLKHLSNHIRRKLSARREKENSNNGQPTTGDTQVNRGDERENPFSRANPYVSEPSED